MQACQTRYHTMPRSPKEVLRAHVDQLSPAQQREFIAVALELIAARDLLDEVEDTVARIQPLSAPLHTVIH